MDLVDCPREPDRPDSSACPDLSECTDTLDCPKITRCLDDPDCTVSPDRSKLPVRLGLFGSRVEIGRLS